MKKVLVFICLTLCALIAAGCSQTGDTSSAPVSTAAPDSSVMESQPESAPESAPETASATTLTVRFGDQGAPFTMHLYDNDTAAAIARHVGTADWRLPIYHYDDFENSEVMQYYDIPSRYEIPSNSENITSEKAGEVYYSEPNRIVLFYGDAQVSGEYTPVGYFDATEDFVRAVEENPVLEGWGNKIVQIAPGSDEPEVSQTSVITTEEQEESNMINLQIGEQNLTAELADNSSAQAFAKLLSQGPLTTRNIPTGPNIGLPAHPCEIGFPQKIRNTAACPPSHWGFHKSDD